MPIFTRKLLHTKLFEQRHLIINWDPINRTKFFNRKSRHCRVMSLQPPPPPPNQNHSGTICGIALNTFLHSGCISIHEFLWRSVDTPKVQICLTRTNSKRNKQTFVNYVICKTYFYIWCERYSYSAIFFYIIRYSAQSFCLQKYCSYIFIVLYIMLFMYKHK